MRCIADANVLLPVIADGHAHRQPVLVWWDGCKDDDVGLCMPMRMALLRLLSNVRMMGAGLLRPVEAWDVIERLASDPRILLVDQTPAGHAMAWRNNVVRR